ncbi:MAG: DUF6048 family protein, partial [Bacteroidota bacterium]
MRLSLYISSLLLTLSFSNLRAQQDSTAVMDSTITKVDSTYTQAEQSETTTDTTQIITPSGLFILIDYGKLITAASDFESKFEAAVGFQLANRIVPTVHVGYATVRPQTAFENGTYESSGVYGRIGFNYLIPLDNTNTYYAGLRYGLST